MILQCPACNARFLVADRLMPPEGRTVKCGKCAHQWHADGPPPVEAPAGEDFASVLADTPPLTEAPIQPVTGQLPVVKARTYPTKFAIIAAALFGVFWLAMASWAYFPSWYGSTADGLVFDEVTMEREEMEGRTRFIIAGSIANHDAVPRTVPLVRVELKNDKGKVVWARAYPVGERLDAGQVYPFRIDNVETSFAGSVATIVLDIGNSMELMAR